MKKYYRIKVLHKLQLQNCHFKPRKSDKIISGIYQKHMHNYLQTMTKPPAKFQKEMSSAVGGVVSTRYLLPEVGDNYITPNTMSPCFSSKRWGIKIYMYTMSSTMLNDILTIL